MAALSAIVETLTDSAERLDDTAVHDIRKATKQLRARLALQRALEGSHPDTEALRHSVKQLAHILGPQRNRFVMNSALVELAEVSDDPALAHSLNSLRMEQTDNALTPGETLHAQELVRGIAATAPRLLDTEFNAQQLDRFLESGLQQVTRAGPELLAGEDYEALHEWRKQVKTLLYQYQLKNSPTHEDERIIERLERLGSCLGKVNDLHMLKNFTAKQQHDGAALSQESLRAILALLDDKLHQELASVEAAFEELAA